MTTDPTNRVIPQNEPKAQPCGRCDFNSGTRGMDRCSRCDGTGSVFRVGTRYYPNTKEGYYEAAAALWAISPPGGELLAPAPCSDLTISELVEWLDGPQYINGMLDPDAVLHMEAAANLIRQLLPAPSSAKVIEGEPRPPEFWERGFDKLIAIQKSDAALIEALKEVLRFYADEKNWSERVDDTACTDCEMDEGEKARHALASGGGKEDDNSVVY